MSTSPKVSVIIPVYNTEKYLNECLDSVVNQKLKEIEIICINDGSTDSSLDIINEYAEKDSRFVVISGPNGGYGKAMNKGLDVATSEYIGIVEPDDYVPDNMFSDLYEIAEKNNLDFVKADFYRFKTTSGTLEKKLEPLDTTGEHYNVVFDPSHMPEAIYFTLNTWCGIYKRDFIEKYHIRHHESPGASFQDNGFSFQTFIYGQRAMIIDTPYYMNRRDNPNSSVSNPTKIYAMNKETDWILDILKKDPEIWNRFKYMFWWRKYKNFCNRYSVIDPSFKAEYMNRFRNELKWAKLRGDLNFDVFEPHEKILIEKLIAQANATYKKTNIGIGWRIKQYIPQPVKDFIKKILWGNKNGKKKR